MDKVFVVQHVHEFDEDNEDVKFIGVYTSHTQAQKTIERLSNQPGFKDTPDGFNIDE